MSRSFRLIGPTFSVSVGGFIVISTYSFFTEVLPFWKNYVGNIGCFFLIAFVFWILFFIWFYFILATLIKPGTAEEVLNYKKYSKNNPLSFDKSVIDFHKILSNPLNIESLNKNNIDTLKSPISTLDNTGCLPREKKINKEDEFLLINNKQLPECKYCGTFKPLRAHHCSICNICILRMDHHCPWISNCIGQNNQRFFILFLVYAQLGTLYMILLSLPILLSVKIDFSSIYFYVLIVDGIAFILTSFFSYWQWKLIIKGETTIEHWDKKNKFNPGINKILDFSFENWKDNLFIVFGTRSLFRAIFIPNIKMLPFSGLEWTKVAFENFEIKDVAYREKKCL